MFRACHEITIETDRLKRFSNNLKMNRLKNGRLLSSNDKKTENGAMSKAIGDVGPQLEGKSRRANGILTTQRTGEHSIRHKTLREN